MRKILLAFILLSIISIDLKAQVRFGITAGIVSSNLVAKDENITVKADPKIGYTIGLLVDYPLASSLGLQTGLNFIAKGNKYEDYDFFTGYLAKYVTTMNILELPILLTYKFDVKNSQLFVGAGPTFSFTLSGKEKFTNNEGVNETSKLNFGSSDEDDYKGFEMGLSFTGGIYLKKNFFASLTYNQGLSNISPMDDVKVHTHYTALRVGYIFPTVVK